MGCAQNEKVSGRVRPANVRVLSYLIQAREVQHLISQCLRAKVCSRNGKCHEECK